jgi:regulator of protease activity HflC (stomatin/prohibitin superfamily)
MSRQTIPSVEEGNVYIFPIVATILIGLFFKWLWVIDVPNGTAVIVKRFGRYHKTITSQGYDFVIWPLFSAHKVSWPQVDAAGQTKDVTSVFVQTTRRAFVTSKVLTKDRVQVSATLMLRYKIKDLRVAVFEVENLSVEISNLLSSLARDTILLHDAVNITSSAAEICSRVFSELKSLMKNTLLECVVLDDLQMSSLHCPQEFLEGLAQLQLAKKQEAARVAAEDALQQHRLKATPNMLCQIAEERAKTYAEQYKILADGGVPSSDIVAIFTELVKNRYPVDSKKTL